MKNKDTKRDTSIGLFWVIHYGKKKQMSGEKDTNNLTWKNKAFAINTPFLIVVFHCLLSSREELHLHKLQVYFIW